MTETAIQPCECGRVVDRDEHHCWWHHVDERPEGAYIVCGECFHVYRTKRDLRRAYRREVWRIARDPIQPPSWAGVPRQRWWHTARMVARAYLIRAERIAFCQECIHDF